MQINDPDGLIHDIKWVPYNDLKKISLSFPDDRNRLLKLFKVDDYER